ncbi:MAG: hypothetical protein IT285_07005, partial [Bdellovibrionales bacterium]|nr:hypothetical protein [Bdellovibrionales bacterium]
QAVEQHHERRDGSGFPNGMSGGSIQKVAEIIGVSEDLVRAYERISRGEKDALLVFKERLDRRFSPQIANAYEKIFVFKSKPGASRGRR